MDIKRRRMLLSIRSVNLVVFKQNSGSVHPTRHRGSCSANGRCGNSCHYSSPIWFFFFPKVHASIHITWQGNGICYWYGTRILNKKHSKITQSSAPLTWLGLAWITAWRGVMTQLRPIGVEGIDGSSYLGLLVNNAILPIGVAVLFAGLIYESTWAAKDVGNQFNGSARKKLLCILSIAPWPTF